MIGNIVVGKDGLPVDGAGKSLSRSAYNPSYDVLKVWAQCQQDYQRAYNLQHRPFDEFDGVSLLERARVDQQTFGVWVGAAYVPEHKRWRWRGRKNTARNKLISILAYMLSGMLYPLVSAVNDEDKPDKLSARVMRIIVENHLKKAGYEMKFMYMVLSALVNPAVFVQIEYLVAFQRIKEEMANGKMKVTEAVDTILSGLNLNVLQIDQLMLGDFYVNDIQQQPFTIRVRRLAYDTARSIHAGKHFVDGVDQFDFVQAGKTRVLMAGNERQVLYDIEWTEGDRDAVQEVTFYYRPDDMEFTFVGGVFMGVAEDIYNSNRFSHRRMSLIEDEWKSIPIYNVAKSYYEPIDPTGRFAYGKSGAFKEYWDDRSLNHAYQLLQDGMTLEVIRPLFISGVAKVDNIVIAPGAATGMPQGATVTPWSMNPGLPMAMNVLQQNDKDMSVSTQIAPAPANATPNVSATQTTAAMNQAAKQLSVFAIMIADLVKQVGELVIDCTIQHTVTGELNAEVPSSLELQYKMVMATVKEKGKETTHRIHFKSNLIGKKKTPQQIKDYEWKLWEDKGGDDQVIWHVNPYKFARTLYSMRVDADSIVNHAMGNDRATTMARYNMLTQPFVYPFTDQKQVADDIIDEFADGDPDRLKSKGQQPMGNVNDMLSAVGGSGGTPTPAGGGNPPPNSQPQPLQAQ